MELLEIQFEGWTATPRLPFVLSGNALCMSVPSYSSLLGLLGCCLGRLVDSNEVRIGFYYSFDDTANDIETRQRLTYDGKRIREHDKGSDAHTREFHINPKLTMWINRVDWEMYFHEPVGTPALGRSQDLLEIKHVKRIDVKPIQKGLLRGCMLPFSSKLQTAGRLVQIAEAYNENDEVGKGRLMTNSRVFITVPQENEQEIKYENLFETDSKQHFYLHEWLS
jgi:CRISPR-associated protein Cas5t